MHQPRRIFFDLTDPDAWMKSLRSGAFVPTRLPLQLGEIFTLSIRMQRVSRSLELPVRVLGRRMPRGAKGILSAGVVVMLHDAHHPTARLLLDLAQGGVVDFEARLRERLRLDATSVLETSADVRSALLHLLEDDEPVLLDVEPTAQPGDRLRLSLGALDLHRPVTLEVEVKGVVLRDGGREVRCKLFDDDGRARVEELLAQPEIRANGR